MDCTSFTRLIMEGVVVGRFHASPQKINLTTAPFGPLEEIFPKFVSVIGCGKVGNGGNTRSAVSSSTVGEVSVSGCGSATIPTPIVRPDRRSCRCGGFSV